MLLSVCLKRAVQSSELRIILKEMSYVLLAYVTNATRLPNERNGNRHTLFHAIGNHLNSWLIPCPTINRQSFLAEGILHIHDAFIRLRG